MTYYTVFHPLFGITETGIWRRRGDPLYDRMITRLTRAEHNGEYIFLDSANR